MTPNQKINEKIAKEREARYRLIQRASAGDEEARKKLEGSPTSCACTRQRSERRI